MRHRHFLVGLGMVSFGRAEVEVGGARARKTSGLMARTNTSASKSSQLHPKSAADQLIMSAEC